jgi:hypothetical protein
MCLHLRIMAPHGGSSTMLGLRRYIAAVRFFGAHLRPVYPHHGCNRAFCETYWEGQVDQLPLPLVKT